MPRAVPSARIIGRIQRLCLFGPGGIAMLPDLLRELAPHVPSSIAPGVFHQGERFLSWAIYSDDPACLGSMRTFVEGFEETDFEGKVARLEPELFPTYRQSPVSEYVERRVKVDRSTWLRSDIYNGVFRSFGFDRDLCMSIPGRTQLLATLQFPRTPSDPEFTKREIRLLEALVPFVAHALTDRRPHGPFVDSEQRALLMVDARGAIQHISQDGMRLLQMACLPPGREPLVMRPRGTALPEDVVRICHRLALWSEDRPASAPPVWRCRNGWGEFVFRVFRLERHADPSAPRLLGVCIERREPLRLKLLRRLGELALSTRETELCLALLDGAARSEIAERMGVSETTAITHTRNLYAKIDVHSRTELIEKLHAM